jgi:site-specific recombinase XerC
VSIAAEMFLAEVKDQVEQDALAPGSYQTYRYQYDKNLAPRIGALRLIESTTPRVNQVIQQIRDEVGAATARTCKSILTGTFGLAVRYGAISSNPVREIKISSKARRKPPRALETEEREQWFELLQQDAGAGDAESQVGARDATGCADLSELGRWIPRPAQRPEGSP